MFKNRNKRAKLYPLGQGAQVIHNHLKRRNTHRHPWLKSDVLKALPLLPKKEQAPQGKGSYRKWNRFLARSH